MTNDDATRFDGPDTQEEAMSSESATAPDILGLIVRNAATVRILARELAWAAEEVRQRRDVREEMRDHTPDEAWEGLTEFQRDQWIRRTGRILDRLDGGPA